MPLIKKRKKSENGDFNFNQSVRAGQIEIAFKNFRLSAIAVLVNTLFLAWVLWDVSDHAYITIFVLAQIMIMGWRILLSIQFHQNRMTHSAEGWKKRFLVGMVLSAAVWGIAPLFIFPIGHSLYESFFIIIYAGMTAGGVSALSSIRYASPTYNAILAVPLIYIVAMQPGSIYLILALSIALYCLVIMVVSGRIYDNISAALLSGMLHERALIDLELTEEHFETIFKEAPAGIFYYDTDLTVIDANDEIMNILQIGPSKMIGLDMNSLSDDRIHEALKTALAGEKGYYEGAYLSTFEQLKIWAILRTSPVYDEKRNIVGGVGIVTDITERVQTEEKIKRQAYFDALTDIPNRALLKDRIEQALAHYRRHHSYIAVLFLDLDHFKTINDSLGHQAGDMLLIETAKRLSDVCREGDTVARLGGDEFVILLEDLGNDPHAAATKAEAVAEKVHNVLSYPYVSEGNESISTSSSIGIVLVSDEGQCAEDLLKYADTAMYQAKKEGRGTTRFYQEQMDQWIKKRLFLENALRQAIANNELKLFYQPVVEVGNNRIIGAEALLRWFHPELGLVMPDEMISIAEESKLIIPIGEWVLEEACRQFVEWKTTHPKAAQLERIAINVSAVQFRQNDFADTVMRIVTETGIRPSMVEIELTESTIIDNIEPTIQKMKQLRDFGVGISMDDFGTGYSSLAYLKRFPFSTLKVDRTFVRDILTDSDDAALVQMIISMASIFKLDVIAEGVELVDQLAFLDRHGCRYFQGYLCSKPLAANEYEELLAQRC